MTALTANELVILVKARDVVHVKLLRDTGNPILGRAHTALLDVLRDSYLDTDGHV